MQCADARLWFGAFVDGQIALTERALIEAHLRRCPECRGEEARLQQGAAARRLVAPSRAVLGALGTAMNAARIEVGRSAVLGAQRSMLLTATAIAVLAHLMASLMQVARLGRARFIASIARLRTQGALQLTASARALAISMEAVRLAVAHSLGSAVIRSRPSVQAAGAVLVLTLTLFALQRANGPQSYAGPVARPGQENEVTRLWTFLAARVWLARPLEQEKGAAAMLSSPLVPISEAVRGVSFRPALVPGPGGLGTRVIGQLATRDRRAAEPHFTALLARVSGTELGRRHRPTFTAVEVIVPRSRYDDFVRGLAHIGSWRLDAARFPLPDAVPMTIRVRE